MRKELQHYIDGEWVDSTGSTIIDVINPATEEVYGQIIDGTKEDIDKAVMATRKAFADMTHTSKEERIDILQRIGDEYEKRQEDITETMSKELGAPYKLSENVHYNMELEHFRQAAKYLETLEFEETRENSSVLKEP